MLCKHWSYKYNLAIIKQFLYNVRPTAHIMHSNANNLSSLVNFGPISRASLAHLGISLVQASADFPKKITLTTFPEL